MQDFYRHLIAHLALAGAALGLGLAFGVALGVLAFEVRAAGRPLLRITASLRVIPSLAMLMIFLPWLGIGFTPAVVAIAILVTAPILLGTESALRNVPFALRENAWALGMDGWSERKRVLWPLAFPQALGGVRTAVVEAIASATLAAFIGGGGLGEYIVEGLASGDTAKLIEGGATVALLAWGAEIALAGWQRSLQHREEFGK